MYFFKRSQDFYTGKNHPLREVSSPWAQARSFPVGDIAIELIIGLSTHNVRSYEINLLLYSYNEKQVSVVFKCFLVVSRSAILYLL